MDIHSRLAAGRTSTIRLEGNHTIGRQTGSTTTHRNRSIQTNTMVASSSNTLQANHRRSTRRNSKGTSYQYIHSTPRYTQQLLGIETLYPRPSQLNTNYGTVDRSQLHTAAQLIAASNTRSNDTYHCGSVTVHCGKADRSRRKHKMRKGKGTRGHTRQKHSQVPSQIEDGITIKL